MSVPSLATLAPELFERLEATDAVDGPRVIHDFFVERIKADEMAMNSVNPSHYCLLEELVQRDILPLYEQFAAKKNTILARQSQRALWKYVLGTVFGLEILESLLTRGRSLTPQLMIPSILMESVLGASLFYFANKLDGWRIRLARSQFFQAIEGLDKKLLVDQQYDAFKEAMGADELVRAEAMEILSQYPKATDFWQDYRRVCQADPVYSEDRKRLGVPAFDRFLELHLKGVYNEVARQRRFHQLFLLAHQVFMDRDPNYITEWLAHSPASRERIKSDRGKPMAEVGPPPIPNSITTPETAKQNEQPRPQKVKQNG